ncbi:MAG TPA: hypothetical protein VKA85_02560, partial [Candidatus Limnocylindrales bacterium]|nr:hypothetical protein [Candidatus Limnocylindrales bacterium]
MTLRVIAGGRDPRRAQGLIVHGASEVATLAGGLRRGEAQNEIAALRPRGARAGDRPVVAAWDGRIVGVGPEADVADALAGDGLPVS